MNFISPYVHRFILIILSGFLVVGATATWHSLGYLSLFGWGVEWSDIIMAFLCVLIATKNYDTKSKSVLYLMGTISFILLILSIVSGTKLTIFVSPSPIYYLVFLIPIVFFFAFVMMDKHNNFHKKDISVIFFFLVLGSVMFLTFLFYQYAPRFPTDESVIDIYSAHLFVNHLNPYNLSNISGAFSFYSYPLYANTPLTTGGYVYYLTYPAMSFIYLIPTTIIGTKSSLEMLPFFAVPIILSWYRAWSRKEWINSILVIIPYLSLSIYASQVIFADLNIIWATCLMTSYYVLPKRKLSGFLFGFALSVKQFPIISAPFLLYFIYREYGKKNAVIWLTTAVSTFLVINGYFIITGFKEFVNAMIANEVAPLMGVGFGLSQISFLDIYNIPAFYFTLAMLALFGVLYIFYISNYNELRYALFSFPIVIFLLNYRLFIQYILYWLILSLLPFLDMLHEKITIQDKRKYNSLKDSHLNSKKAKVVIISVILLSSVAVGIEQGVTNNPGSFKLNSVTIDSYNSTGFVNEINVNLTFNGISVSNTDVLFRFIIPEPIGNVNMYLWHPMTNISLYSGHSTSIIIIPDFSVDSLPPGTQYRLIAYYGNIIGSFTGTI